jgi:hypothetical protein
MILGPVSVIGSEFSPEFSHSISEILIFLMTKTVGNVSARIDCGTILLLVITRSHTAQWMMLSSQLVNEPGRSDGN